MKKIEVVKPTLQDLETVLAIEKAAWPDVGEGMVAESEKFKTRLELGNMFMLYLNDNPAGIISFLHPTFLNEAMLNDILTEYDHGGLLNWNHLVTNYGLPKDWYDATLDGFTEKNGMSVNDFSSECLFLIGVGVDGSLKGNGLVNHLIGHTISSAKKMGKKYLVGYGRLPQLHESGLVAGLADAEKHLLQKKSGTDLPADYGARFHVFNGAKAVAVIPKAMDDSESLNYGFLAVYKLT